MPRASKLSSAAGSPFAGALICRRRLPRLADWLAAAIRFCFPRRALPTTNSEISSTAARSSSRWWERFNETAIAGREIRPAAADGGDDLGFAGSGDGLFRQRHHGPGKAWRQLLLSQTSSGGSRFGSFCDDPGPANWVSPLRPPGLSTAGLCVGADGGGTSAGGGNYCGRR